MPKCYSDKEKKEITASLRLAAMEAVKVKGIKKTTVDELVEAVHIPKGTFYLFYESKELLIYDAIMEQHNSMHEKLGKEFVSKKDSFTIETFTTFLVNAFTEGFNMGIIPLMMNGEMEILIRKLPDSIVSEHLKNDEDFFEIFKLIFPNLKKSSIDKYSASFRAIFFSVMFKREIGKHFDKVIQTLIKGIVIQMWSENNDSNK